MHTDSAAKANRDKVHAALPMQDSGTIPFKELSFVKLALYKGLSFEFIIQLFS